MKEIDVVKILAPHIGLDPKQVTHLLYFPDRIQNIGRFTLRWDATKDGVFSM